MNKESLSVIIREGIHLMNDGASLSDMFYYMQNPTFDYLVDIETKILVLDEFRRLYKENKNITAAQTVDHLQWLLDNSIELPLNLPGI